MFFLFRYRGAEVCEILNLLGVGFVCVKTRKDRPVGVYASGWRSDPGGGGDCISVFHLVLLYY